MKKEYLDIFGISAEENFRGVDWLYISCYKKLPEEFIREFKDYVDWINISVYQKLSLDFIREFKNHVNWDCISRNQKISEEIFREFKDHVNWDYISSHQKLSENFIREFKDYVQWSYITKYQKLSQDFIREFKNYVDWNYIFYSYPLSEDFIEEFREQLSIHNWKYANKEIKMKAVKDSGLYDIDGDYIFAYKTTKEDGYSVYDFSYKYEIGKIYESDCDCNINNGNSFGLSAWTKEGALKYYPDGELYKVKIHIDDVGALVHNCGKLRCFRLEVIGQINNEL